MFFCHIVIHSFSIYLDPTDPWETTLPLTNDRQWIVNGAWEKCLMDILMVQAITTDFHCSVWKGFLHFPQLRGFYETKTLVWFQLQLLCWDKKWSEANIRGWTEYVLMLMHIIVDCRDQLISIPRAQSVQYYADARPHSNFLTTIYIIIITIIFNPDHHYHTYLHHEVKS